MYDTRPQVSAALVMAGLIAGGMVASTVRVEAKGKGDGTAAICAYLLQIINHDNVNPYIKVWATSLYRALECTPALP